MAIVIKEIHVKTTIEKSSKLPSVLTEEVLRKLKREIIQEVIKIQEKKLEWERER